MFSLLYLILYKPFSETLTQKLEEFNNITEVFLLYSVLTFTDANPSYLSVVYDVIFITPLIGNICVHFYFLLKSSYYELKERVLKNRCYKKFRRCVNKKATKTQMIEYKNDAHMNTVMTPSEDIMKVEDYSVEEDEEC